MWRKATALTKSRFVAPKPDIAANIDRTDEVSLLFHGGKLGADRRRWIDRRDKLNDDERLVSVMGWLLRMAGVLASSAVFGSDPGSFDRTLNVTGTVELDAKSDRGGVYITVGSAASVRVRAILKPMYGRLDLDLAEANIRALEMNPPIEQIGNRIRIGYPKDPALLRGVSMRLEIEIPPATQVCAQTVSGGIRIDGVLGSLTTETISGRTEIRAAKGPIIAESRSGAIQIAQIAPAPIRVRTKSGRITAELAKQGGYQVEARSDSGKVSGWATRDRKQGADRRRFQKQRGAPGGPLVELVAHSSEIEIN